MLEHQLKLMVFIQPLAQGQEVKSGTPAFKPPYTRASADAAIADKANPIVDNPLFAKLTGRTHRQLLEKWISDKTTTCNDFVTQCGIAMGFTGLDVGGKDKYGVGRFDIADILTRLGLAHCWVPASSGATPEYGDPFRVYAANAKDPNGLATLHMGVFLWSDTDGWHTVEAGQGGPSSGYDSVKMLVRPGGMPASVSGWVSMRALLAAGKQTDPWLGGWWEIDQPGSSHNFYYFGAGGKVVHTSLRPAHGNAKPTGDMTTGTYERPPRHMYDLRIRWPEESLDESWACWNALKPPFQMNGTDSKGVKMKAKRIGVDFKDF
ncbi:hypothetical protein [Sphingomonas sp.]|uniref:hypothetical protein n=1 Tax=Sphingomonas sp. TaxID=28214 RepID=UPI003CC52E49